MANYNDLEVYKVSYELTLGIYEVTKGFPEEEKFGLVSQLRRAAYGVPLNIVEGNGRRHIKENIQFLNTAKASNDEVHFLLQFTKDLGFLKQSDFVRLTELSDRISKMLTRLMQSLERKNV